MGRKRKSHGKAIKPGKPSFGSALGDDFRPVAKPVKVKRSVDGPRLKRKDLENQENRKSQNLST
jgi:hypothetical protein